jgi:hypothetical protein
MKFCLTCAKPLGDKRKSASYCSNGCRSLGYRKRKGLDEPDFLKTKKSGYERSRAVLTAEEEQKVKYLELEISNYKQHLPEAEENFKEFHAIKVRYEVTGKHFVEDNRGNEIEYKFKPSYLQPPPVNNTVTKPREGVSNYDEKFKNYETKLAEYNEEYSKYEERRAIWKDNKFDNDIQNVIYKPFQLAEAHLQKIAKQIIDRKNQIEEITNTAADRTRERNQRDNDKGRFKGSDLLKMKFTTLPFEGKWKELIGTPNKSFYGLIWGDAKAGKSYFSIEFAQYLTNFGKTLYIAVEEGVSHTLQKKIKDVKAKDIEILATREFTDIAENIEDAEFVFIDSATVINVPPESVEALRTQFPDVAFIVLLQSVKAGANFKGNQAWKHNADFILELEKIGENSTRATCTGRFGNGKIEYSY